MFGCFVCRISTKKQTHTSSCPSKLRIRSRVRSASARKKRSIEKRLLILISYHHDSKHIHLAAYIGRHYSPVVFASSSSEAAKLLRLESCITVMTGILKGSN